MSNKQKTMSNHKPSAKSESSQKKLPLWMWVGLGLFVVIAVAAGLFFNSAGAPSAALPPEISVAQAAEKRAAGAFMLDVREPSEWQEIHIPDAALIPLGELESRVNELPKDQEIVVVCRSGNRSQAGRDILLKKAGFEKVTSMAGGMNEWYGQGFPTTSGQ